MSAVPAMRQALATAYRLALHDAQCRPSCPDREGCSWTWVAHQSAPGWLAAVEHLEAHPRDARGARRILHDATCLNGADCPSRERHTATHTVPVRALRKVMAERPMMLASEPELTCLEDMP